MFNKCVKILYTGKIHVRTCFYKKNCVALAFFSWCALVTPPIQDTHNSSVSELSCVIVKSKHTMKTCSLRRFQRYPTTFICSVLTKPLLYTENSAKWREHQTCNFQLQSFGRKFVYSQ